MTLNGIDIDDINNDQNIKNDKIDYSSEDSFDHELNNIIKTHSVNQN